MGNVNGSKEGKHNEFTMKALGHDHEIEMSNEGLSQIMNGQKMNIHSKRTLYELAQQKVQTKKKKELLSKNMSIGAIADIGVGSSSMEQELDANVSSLTLS